MPAPRRAPGRPARSPSARPARSSKSPAASDACVPPGARPGRYSGTASRASAGGQIGRHRDIRRRPPGPALVPRRPGAAVTAGVLTDPAERQQRQALEPRVHQLAAHRGADARDAPTAQHVLLPLDDQRQLALDDHVDLLLLLVRVDPAALAGPQRDEVDAEGADAELAA